MGCAPSGHRTATHSSHAIYGQPEVYQPTLRQGLEALALELCILAASRSCKELKAEVSEIDFDWSAKVITASRQNQAGFRSLGRLATSTT
jgi:hypothetical protein